jgi:hypothetical protein
MHPTRDTPALIYRNLVGGRVMPGVMPLRLMRIDLTDDVTLLSKWVVPPVFGGIAILMLVQLLRHAQELRAEDYWFAAMWLPCAIFACGFFLRLKNVSMDEQFLYVSNYAGEVAVPLSSIIGVKETSFPLNMRRVFVYLSESSAFGRVIMFQPQFSDFFRLKKSQAFIMLQKVVRQNNGARA